jgi:hypothetical protein
MFFENLLLFPEAFSKPNGGNADGVILHFVGVKHGREARHQERQQQPFDTRPD